MHPYAKKEDAFFQITDEMYGVKHKLAKKRYTDTIPWQ